METKYRIFLIRYRREISAVLAGIGILILISIIKSSVPTITAVVASQTIPAGTKINESHLSERKIPSSLKWGGLITQPQLVIGKVSSHSIEVGAPFSNSDLISSDLLVGFTENKIAISIPVSSNRLDAYLVSGNRINVYASQPGMEAKLVAFNATVLFVPPAKSGGFSISSSSETSIILAVNQNESLDIAANIGNGNFSFALLPN